MQFLTEGTLDLSQTQWDAQSEGKLCMGLDDWTQVNTLISAVCSSAGIHCTNAAKTALARFSQVLRHAAYESQAQAVQRHSQGVVKAPERDESRQASE